MNRDRSSIAYTIIIILLIMALFVCARVAGAQEPVRTWFTVDCMEWVDDNTYRIHFGYVSNGVEEFVATFDFPPATAPYITSPPAFMTVPGEHKYEWYLEADSTVDVLTYFVTFDNGYLVHRIGLSIWNAPLCDWQLVATPPGMPTEPATSSLWAWNSATGTFYRYTPLAAGVVPLPAAGV